MKRVLVLFLMALPLSVRAQQTNSSFTYRVEASAAAADGDYSPLWLTANRYGIYSVQDKQALARAGLFYHKGLKHHWNLDAGVDLVGGAQLESSFWVQQAYVDLAWKKLCLSVGNKERSGFLEKNQQLSSGWMVEGPNARPVPQIRAEIKDYWSLPGTRQWVGVKGHLAYGWFVDGNWQEDFAGPGYLFVKHALYHSKSLMFRIGNRAKLPLEMEFGLLMDTQFGGNQYIKYADGTTRKTMDMPSDLKAYLKAFIPHGGGLETTHGEQVNVEGNMLGSWNFSLNYYPGDWAFKLQYEHFFEDHSQMFWEYGRWKDGQLGIEITPPANRWISGILWEGLCTKDQTKGILYDGYDGSFPDLQMSGGDDYYNHNIYQSWQHYGQGMGNPLLPGPAYNETGSTTFRSNRVRSHHLGISGEPSSEWKWRMLASFARHWGTYSAPLDKQRKQFSGLLEVTYLPGWTKGWSAAVSVGMDRGNYLGNTLGGMLTLRKVGGFDL